jgi:hypothetical protein
MLHVNRSQFVTGSIRVHVCSRLLRHCRDADLVATPQFLSDLGRNPIAFSSQLAGPLTDELREKQP